MKKTISLLLILCLVLCGCAGEAPVETTAVPTTEPVEVTETVPPTTQEPTEPPTEAPTEPPIPSNPLTGEILETPLESRIFAVSINNVAGAMPMFGVSKADLFFEMYVNDYCTRGLAMYADISEVASVGSVRSNRYNFTDLCQSYDAIIVHASASKAVTVDMKAARVQHVNAGVEGKDYFYRDGTRLNQGYAWEHCLFIKGPETLAFAREKGLRVDPEPGRDYGLVFAEDGTPDGEDAGKITISLKHEPATKQTIMEYDAEAGKYKFFQYGNPVYDDSEDQYIFFENVIVMLCRVYDDTIYHVADMEGSGEGFYACNGKIIPIAWSHESVNDPIIFTHLDGTPLELGVGNSYIAIAPLASLVEYE